MAGRYTGFAVRSYQNKNRAHDFRTLIEEMYLKNEFPQDDGGELSLGAKINLEGLPREIPRAAVKITDKLGAGAFGEVAKAVLDESKHGGVAAMIVAVR